MSRKLILAFSSKQNPPTLYLTSLAALGSASATYLALTYFKPNNLRQNDLYYDWKSLSILSGIGSMLTLHYGITNELAPISLLNYFNSMIVTSLWKGIKSIL